MIAVIGCGNMSNAIIKGIYNKYPDEKFLTYTPSHTRAKNLAKAVNGKAVSKLSDLKEAHTLIIACKPQQFDQLVKDFNHAFSLKEKYVISIMAAISIETLERKLETKNITRVMPNTPALVGNGISLIYHQHDLKKELKNLSEMYFKSCSEVYVLNSEKEFNELTAISGSGPAYLFLFAQGLVEKAKQLGLPESAAKKMVVELIQGSTKLIESAGEKNLDTLISEVTSKGGVTIEAVNIYKEKDLNKITSQAVDAAIERSIQISKEFSS